MTRVQALLAQMSPSSPMVTLREAANICLTKLLSSPGFYCDFSLCADCAWIQFYLLQDKLSIRFSYRTLLSHSAVRDALLYSTSVVCKNSSHTFAAVLCTGHCLCVVQNDYTRSQHDLAWLPITLTVMMKYLQFRQAYQLISTWYFLQCIRHNLHCVH